MKDHDILGQEDYFVNPKPEDKKDDKEKPEDAFPPRQPEEVHPEETEDLFDTPDEDEEKDDFEFPGLNEIEESDADSASAGQKKPREQSGDFLDDVNDSFKLDNNEADDEIYEEPEYTEPGYEDEEYVYDSYEDEKQEKVGYKPIIIGGIVIVLLTVAFFAIWQFFLKDSPKTEIAETPSTPAQTETPGTAETVQTREEQQKTQYFSTLAGKASQDLSFLSQLIGTMNNNNRLSSILLYGDDLFLQVFSDNRDGLAKLNLKLKDNFKSDKFSIVSTEQRPGSNGGVFGLYSINLKNRSGNNQAQVNNPLSGANEAEAWLQSLVRQNNVNIKGIKHRSPSSSDQFQVYEIETNIAGPLQDCLNLLKGIAAAGKNIEIHKLTFNAADQRTFNKSNYLLTMILNVYV